MNYLFFILIGVSIIAAIINGTVTELVNSMLDACNTAVKIALSLIGIMAFWLGLMKIAHASGLMNLIARILSPLIHLLFPEIPKNNPVQADITMNISANALGLGNAATPFGIKAMEGLQKLNTHDKKTASDAMCTFLTINTAGVQLIPVTAIAILASLNADNPTDIIIPTIITTLSALIIGIIFVKGLIKIFPKKVSREEKIQ